MIFDLSTPTYFKYSENYKIIETHILLLYMQANVLPCLVAGICFRGDHLMSHDLA